MDRFGKSIFAHFTVIIALLSIHYFSDDIYIYFSFNSFIKKYSESSSENLKVYRNGLYVPILKKDTYRHLPRDVKIVVVEKDSDITKEIYFSKNGDIIEAIYVNNIIQSITAKSIPSAVSFSIPLLGIVFGIYSVVHNILRTGNIITWGLMRRLDSLEKVCIIYTISLFGFGLLLLIIKHGSGVG
jgi:hypothetical protein